MTAKEIEHLASLDVNEAISAAADRAGKATTLASSIELALSQAREELSEALSRCVLYQADIADAKARIAEGLTSHEASGLEQATFLYTKANRDVLRLRERLTILKLHHTEAKARLALLARMG